MTPSSTTHSWVSTTATPTRGRCDQLVTRGAVFNSRPQLAQHCHISRLQLWQGHRHPKCRKNTRILKHLRPPSPTKEVSKGQKMSKEQFKWNWMPLEDLKWDYGCIPELDGSGQTDERNARQHCQKTRIIKDQNFKISNLCKPPSVLGVDSASNFSSHRWTDRHGAG